MSMFSLIFKIRSVKVKMFIVITLILVIYLIVSFVLLEKWYTKSQKENHESLKQKWNITLQYVVVHFDLKGSPPSLSYLQSILKQLKDHGVTALLIEYEDMFPFDGVLVNLTARNYYRKDELKQFLKFASQTGLEIIPLVQTFGHMEYVLKLREFMHLRENPKYPDSICPSRNESQELIREMLKQVIEFHSTIAPLKHIHIGFDEVYQIRVCTLCFKKKTNLALLLSHIKFISGVIWDLSPKTKILIWEDMFKGMRPTRSIELRFPNIESVCWDYRAEELENIHPNLYKYERMFDNQWVATAYKGADGPTRSTPILIKRFANHLNWLNFIMTYESIYKLYHFKGIILTGWSRYSHLEPPCELLPVAMPSLLLNLILIEKYHKGVFFTREFKHEEQKAKFRQEYINTFIANDLNSALTCENCIVDGSLSTFQAHACVFDGSTLYTVLERYTELRKAYLSRFYGGHNLEMSAELNMDDIKEGYINMFNVKSVMDTSIMMMKQLAMIESQMVDAMTDYYDKFVIDEYIYFKFSTMKKDLNELIQYLREYYVVKHWPRRPYYNLTLKFQDDSDRDILAQY